MTAVSYRMMSQPQATTGGSFSACLFQPAPPIWPTSQAEQMMLSKANNYNTPRQ
jgi:hypothetical protein